MTKDTKGLLDLKVKCLIWLEEMKNGKKGIIRNNINSQERKEGAKEEGREREYLKVNRISKYFGHFLDNR